MDCPKCNGIATDINPLKGHTEQDSVYACPACKYVFKHDKTAFCSDATGLHDIFKGATEAQRVIDSSIGEDTKLPIEMMAILKIRMVEYGLQMWFDGLKQGLLLGVENGKIRNK